jgi:hypothetical protein
MSARSGSLSWVLCLAVAAAIFTAGFISRRAALRERAPSLSPAPKSLDIGDVWEQAELKLNIPVTNTSSQPIDIRKIERDCQCTTIEGSEFHFQPAETREIPVTLNLTGLKWSGSQREQPVRISLLPQLSDRDGLQPVWVIHGNVRRNPIHFSQDSISYAEPLLYGQRHFSRTIAISTDSSDACSGWRATVEPDEAATLVVETPDDGMASRLTITPSSFLEQGPFSFRVRIETDCANRASRVARILKVDGRIENDVEARPSTVDFGVLDVGGERPAEITVSARSGRAIRILSVETGKNCVVIESPKPDESRLSHTILVQQRIASAGESREKLVIEAESDIGIPDVFEPQPPLTVTLRYRGVAADAELQEAEADVAAH